jgi:hypothetical protein
VEAVIPTRKDQPQQESFDKATYKRRNIMIYIEDIIVAHDICRKMEEAMRQRGVITTAHYDGGAQLIVEAMRAARKHGREEMRERAAAEADAVEAEERAAYGDQMGSSAAVREVGRRVRALPSE